MTPFPSSHTMGQDAIYNAYTMEKTSEKKRCPKTYDSVTGAETGHRSDCPADYQCQGTSETAGTIKCAGKTAQYCCTQASAALCAGTPKMKINGVAQYFWGCSLTQYFTGAAVTLKDGSVAYLNGTVDMTYVNRTDGATFTHSSCYTYPPSQCVHGVNITAQTSPSVGKCTCFVGYEGEHCTHGPFSIPLRHGVETCLLYTSPSPRDS